MDRDMNILYILGVPLGYVMEWIYNLIPNYGWDIIIFTIVIRLLSIPLQLNQQKSMAKTVSYTHLDVYKRQDDSRPVLRWSFYPVRSQKVHRYAPVFSRPD